MASYPPPGQTGYPPPGQTGYPPPGQQPQQWKPGTGPAPADLRTGAGPPDDSSQGPPQQQPCYPPMESMPKFENYFKVDFKGTEMPPPLVIHEPQGDPPPMEYTDMAKLDEEDCRAAMVQFVSEHCCYGSKPAKEMKITSHVGITALHLVLETYMEFRKTKFDHMPYRGGPVDGPENGPPPPPWVIPCSANELFRDQKVKLEVPHTSTVRECHDCHGRGYHRCWRCHGWGHVKCISCHGRGRRRQQVEGQSIEVSCSSCGGDGRRRCFTCGGDGRITCKVCDGYCQLRHFILLIVKFNNKKDDFILEKTDMPDELVADVGGKIVHEQTVLQVWPITAYPVREINDNSIRLVESHKGKWPNGRQLQQRHTLRGVPVTEVAYTWDDVKTRFWVYGNERKVYAPDYPQQCCWGCSVL